MSSTPYIEVGGVRYAYLERGSGPLIVFFHGTLSAKESFLESIAELSSEYRCVAFDWPGHGESTYDRERLVGRRPRCSGA